MVLLLAIVVGVIVTRPHAPTEVDVSVKFHPKGTDGRGKPTYEIMVKAEGETKVSADASKGEELGILTHNTKYCTVSHGDCGIWLTQNESAFDEREFSVELEMTNDDWTKSVSRTETIKVSPQIQRNTSTGVICRGMKCKTAFHKDHLSLSVWGVDDKTEITLAGKTVTGKPAKEAKKLTAKVPLFDIAKRLDVATYAKNKVELPLKVVIAGEVILDEAITFDTIRYEKQKVVSQLPVLTPKLNAATYAGVRFGKADKLEGKPRTLLYGSGSRKITFGADIKSVIDIDLIAYQTRSTKRTRSCGIYVSKSTGERVAMEGYIVSYTVGVFDRRTGRRLTSRKFTGVGNPCPGRETAGRGGGSVYPDSDKVHAWLKRQVK